MPTLTFLDQHIFAVGLTDYLNEPLTGLHPSPARCPAALQITCICTNTHRAPAATSHRRQAETCSTEGRETDWDGLCDAYWLQLKHLTRKRDAASLTVLLQRHINTQTHTCTQPEDTWHSGPPTQALAISPLGSRRKR